MYYMRAPRGSYIAIAVKVLLLHLSWAFEDTPSTQSTVGQLILALIGAKRASKPLEGCMKELLFRPLTVAWNAPHRDVPQILPFASFLPSELPIYWSSDKDGLSSV